MTGPGVPSGADAAGARNRAAVDRLERQALPPVRVAVYEVLAALLAELDTTAPAPPAPATTAAVARSAWRRGVDGIRAWVRQVFGRLLTRAVDNVPDSVLDDDTTDEVLDDDGDLVDDLAPDVPGPTIDDRAAALLDQVTEQLESVPDTIAARVTRELADGYQDGDTPAELRARVAAVLGRDEWDAEVVRIARTTTTTVYNAAHTTAANELEVQLGRPLQRMWIATQDSRTRPTHREAHAQVIESGQRFRVGKALLRFPGDPLGPPEEIILCRCVVTPVVNDLVVDLARRVTTREAEALDMDVDDVTADVTASSGDAGDADLTARMIAVSDVLRGATRMPPQFVSYWTVGEGGAGIRWNTDGDFTRCTRALRRYLEPQQVNGACANLHKLATGKWPNERGDAVAAEGTENMPCPCENDEDTVSEPAAVTADVTADLKLPIADRDREWDGDAAADRVREWAIVSSDDEGIDLERYASAFFWRSPDAATDPAEFAQSDYKLGFADVVGDELVAVPSAIFAVASVLEGGRGGVDIPADDADAVRAAVGTYYGRMAEEFDDAGLTPPWGDESDPDAEMTADAAGDAAGVVACSVCQFDITPGLHSQSDCDANLAAFRRFREDAVRKIAAAVDVPIGLIAPDISDEGAPRTRFNAYGVPQLSAASLDSARSGAMIALVPSEQDAARLAVNGDGAVPPDELHTTVLFLGEGTDWEGTDRGAALAALVERVAADVGPISGHLWQMGVTGGDEPVPMYLVGDDTGRLAALQAGMIVAGGEIVPPQHSPYVAHISTRYGNAAFDGMDALGSDVTFDRLRVSYGPDNVDYPLTGDDTLELDDVEDDGPGVEDDDADDGAAVMVSSADTRRAQMTDAGVTDPGGAPGGVVNLAAAADTRAVLAQAADNAPESLPAAWLEPIAVQGPTPPTVTAQGRVWGHIGQAVDEDGSLRCHVGITDECVPIPPTRTGYGAFHHDEIVTAEGDLVAVGYLYTGCGHSSTGMTLDQAREHLDAACVRTAVGRVHDTEWGPLFTGGLVPGITADNVAQLWKLSGEWFTAPLELHAAVGVTDAGYPVDGTSEDGLLVSDTDPDSAGSGGDLKPAEVAVAAAAVDTYQRTRTTRASVAAITAAAAKRAHRQLGTYQRRG